MKYTPAIVTPIPNPKANEISHIMIFNNNDSAILCSHWTGEI